MKNKMLLAAALVLFGLGVTGCGKVEYKDGTYENHVDANAPVDEEVTDEEAGQAGGKSTVLGKADIKITIKDGKITDCQYKAWNAKGDPKDESYGKDGAALNYKKAQKAVAGLKKYCEELVKVQNIDDVDVVTGATISYDEFIEAAKGALKKAEK